MIVDLGKPRIILEILWLKRYNPTIDWKKKTLKWKNEEVFEKLIDFQKEKDQCKQKIYKLNMKTSILQQLSLTNEKQAKKQVKIPLDYYKYQYLFNKKKSEKYPSLGIQDHKIKTKPTFKPKVSKPYKLSLKEIEKQEKFIKENL